MNDKIDTLVLSGGGIKGIAYIGVFRKLREMDIKIKEICCVSVGSIMGLLYMLGYKNEELLEEIKTRNFDNLKDIKIGNFINRYGIDTGKNIVRWIEELLERKGYSKDVTFIDLYKILGVKYRVLATNLNKYESTIFDYMTTPVMKITRAIRMSISIPFVFTVQRYMGDIHIDGAIVNNYPIELYKDRLDSVLGMNVITMAEKRDGKGVNQLIEDISGYIYNVMTCFLIFKSKTLLEEYKKRTLSVCIEDIMSAMNFDIENDMKEKLVNCGYKCACEFFT